MYQHIIPYESGRVAILSDPHVDDYYRTGLDFITSHGLEAVLDDTLDAVIIAGDLANGPTLPWIRGLDHLTPHIASDRIYVFPGNHDFYGGTLADDHLLAEAAQSIGAHYVQKAELCHGDTRFLCCTLWTNFDLLGDAAKAMNVAGRIMRDYSRIRKEASSESTDTSGLQRLFKSIVPEDTLAVHNDHRAWLEARLMEPHPVGEAGRTVIVTHHGPHPSVAGPIDALTPAFHSDLTDLIEAYAPDAWFFGHSHRRLRATVGRTDIRNVSVGYAREYHQSESGYLIDACVWES